ncbi:MAG: polysaccharide export protein [Armatimonadota bacterium]|nr:MAG: polysaccharide export protein [Armatimonadota bacterium]
MSAFERLFAPRAKCLSVAFPLIAALLIGAPAALAAEGIAEEDAGPAAVSVSETAFPDYLVRVGDRIQFSVWGEPELTTDTVVMPDGTISLPLMGTFRVLGKSVPTVTEEVKQECLRYLKDPQIYLSCIPRVPPQVYVEGAVDAPGPVPYDPRFSLLDYLTQAGGPTPDADLSNVIITRVQGDQVTSIEVDMYAPPAAGGSVETPRMSPGDTIWVGRALPVSVVGEVENPGVVPYRQGLRLSDYIALAGGPTERADRVKSWLKHTEAGVTTSRRVNIAIAMEQPDTLETNPILAPGDAVTVPEKFLAGGLEWADVLRVLSTTVLWWHRR